MGRCNVLIDGLSGTGKTTLCDALLRRGHHAIHGDRQLAYPGDPDTGARLAGPVAGTDAHAHHLWDLDAVRALVADRSRPLTFFCGGARNLGRTLPLFDRIFVLRVDRATLERRLAGRPADEFGGRPDERALILRLYGSGDDALSGAVPIDAARPPDQVADAVLRLCRDLRPRAGDQGRGFGR